MSSPRPRTALVLAVAFAVAISTNYTNQGPLLGLISREFGLTSADVGAVATAFFAGAAATMLFGGVLAERWGARRAVTIGFLLVLVGNAGSGLLAPTFPALLAWRLIGGLGAGFGFVAGSTYLRSVFRQRGGHVAMGLYGAGFLLGSGGVLVVMPLLAGSPPEWRRGFALSSLAVGAVLAAWLRWAPHVDGRGALEHGGLRAAVRLRNSWILALCHMCGFGMAMIVGTWVTAYFQTEFRLPLAEAGGLGSVLLVTGIAGRSAGGAFIERGVSAVGLLRTSLALCALGLALLALPARPLPVALLALLVTGLGVGLPYAAVFNGAAASAPSVPASAQSFVGWGGMLVAVFGPPIVGLLLDLTGSFGSGFAALALFALVVLITTAVIRPFSFADARAVRGTTAPT